MTKITEVQVKGTVWTKQTVIDMLNNNDEFMYRSLIRLYDFQDQQEKDTVQTKFKNNKGFSASDGRFLSVAARFYLKHKKTNKNPMPRDYKEKVRARLIKYSNQLWDFIVDLYRERELAF
jgi:hypothetical protein